MDGDGLGTKRHSRTQSLEDATKTPNAKRFDQRSGFKGLVRSGNKRHQRKHSQEESAEIHNVKRSAQYKEHQGLDELSDSAEDFEAAYVVNSVGEMPTMYKSAMESSDAEDDVCGPMQTATFGGMRYFVTFIDENSHFIMVYLLRNKSEVAGKFASFVAYAETQTGKVLKALCCDNGGEYSSSK
ncbi:FOG: Transposon-encoded proteins with TYA, reverse transcriptase, integrase domains in various combinations [Plasmopara halstedii]|uniref:FOG: Transposon-encoded proteins with TYA, reverse transcriptase, integrase domains in various combinations n=1 Tax=Plasmopara halstedii TaxID=4781 RepID=A0A0P1AFJ5_PLAHL|nr:FOG: Transposon-encoded proteins with TYA, reverse transcriptase, integrase domains in various combinations [Plasmopara halstedii]CEG39783.1 FOG: Transposon-encoded proteins with TYA, reverse transcriptase, integrase domains in various combinations [Plasmopara halstedii]|eukprot:XP_024576152.1 FOG: Transposon-encoded proteins with TYA, reverse transcriptase, integrase domains in various combinations [Plasmopara halstedii]